MVKNQLRKKIAPKFKETDIVRHIGTGIEGMVHDVALVQVINTPQGPMQRPLSEPVYTITHLDAHGIIHTFQTKEKFFTLVESGAAEADEVLDDEDQTDAE